jgi:hypothetical protein
MTVLVLSSVLASLAAPLIACAGARTSSDPAGSDPTEGKAKADLSIVPIDPGFPILLPTNLLYNPSFETPDLPLVPLYSGFVDRGNPPNAYFAGWGTAAQDWPATSNVLQYSTVTTWLTNVTGPGSAAGTHSILVANGTEDGGIAQQYLGGWTAGTTIPLHQQVTVQAKVLAGTLTVGIGNSSQTNVGTTWAYGYSQVNPNTNGPEWETVSVCAPTGVNANEVIFYALGAAATYYLDNASVYTNASACP